VLWTSLESVAEGIYRRVCPLYGVDHRDHLHVVGSAIPFDSRGFRFLLSAAHVCLEDDGPPRPLFTMGAEKEWPLVGRRGSWEYKPTQMPDIDIAVIGLDDACADDLQQYYQFTTPADVATLEPRTPITHFFVAGNTKPIQIGWTRSSVEGDLLGRARPRRSEQSASSRQDG
jgi:hypothetical protein